jgi:hypothetical protein
MREARGLCPGDPDLVPVAVLPLIRRTLFARTVIATDKQRWAGLDGLRCREAAIEEPGIHRPQGGAVVPRSEGEVGRVRRRWAGVVAA